MHSNCWSYFCCWDWWVCCSRYNDAENLVCNETKVWCIKVQSFCKNSAGGSELRLVKVGLRSHPFPMRDKSTILRQKLISLLRLHFECEIRRWFVLYVVKCTLEFIQRSSCSYWESSYFFDHKSCLMSWMACDWLDITQWRGKPSPPGATVNYFYVKLSQLCLLLSMHSFDIMKNQ